DLGVSTGVEMDFALPRQQGAVILDAGLHTDHRRMLGDRVEHFFTRQQHAHRRAGLLCRRGGNGFDLWINFAAVAAAEIGHDDTYRGNRDFEDVGKLGSYDEGVLRRRPDGYATAWVERRNAGMSVQKTMLRRRQCERIFENMIRFGKAFLNISAIEFEVRTDVGAFYWLELGKIGKTGFRYANRLMNQRPSWLQCLVDIQNRW